MNYSAISTLYTSPARFMLALLLLASLLITACSSSDSRRINLLKSNEAQLYDQAERMIKTEFYDEAIEALELIEKRYPFGEYSKAAQLSLMYAYYRNNDPESAEATIDRFIRLNPRHRHVDYAYYVKGLNALPNSQTIFQKFFDVDMGRRDISEAQLAFTHFATLVKRFPESRYTPDALKRMAFLRNLIARQEIHVANYYFSRKAFLAAANRGRYVVENFQQTAAVPDGLAVMAQAYHFMEIHDLANDAIRVLKENYPDYPALNKNGEFDFSYSTTVPYSWVNIATLGLLRQAQPPGFNTKEIYNPVKEE